MERRTTIKIAGYRHDLLRAIGQRRAFSTVTETLEALITEEARRLEISMDNGLPLKFVPAPEAPRALIQISNGSEVLGAKDLEAARKLKEDIQGDLLRRMTIYCDGKNDFSFQVRRQGRGFRLEYRAGGGCKASSFGVVGMTRAALQDLLSELGRAIEALERNSLKVT
jgi:hypothetical protein